MKIALLSNVLNSKLQIGFGGGCHWCTEAIFQHLNGVYKVEQGWIASNGDASSFSEAVIVHYDATIIPLKVLVEIHLHTHKSTSKHSMREKYRSGVYVYSEMQKNQVTSYIKELQVHFENPIITKVFPFEAFKASREQIQNYYKKNPNKPFCETFINPKLEVLLRKFPANVVTKNLPHLNIN